MNMWPRGRRTGGIEIGIKTMVYRAGLIRKVGRMRMTVALDDELVAKARAFTGLKENSALIREALKVLIERESARRLARLGGSEPDLAISPRRAPKIA